MARCKHCPALKDDGIAVIEYYSMGDGCPDEDFDTFGGDCVNARGNDSDDEHLQEDMAYEMERAHWEEEHNPYVDDSVF